MTEKQADVGAIFDRAVAIDSLQQRREYLDEACGDDPQLRGRVEALLRADQNAGSFLENPPEGLAATIATDLHTADASSLDDVSLDFLTPSDKFGCLGTLGFYEVIEIVGRGGMGLVLRAYDTKLNRVVAIKVMAPELAASGTSVKRFLREAQAAAAVSHDHVVTIHAIEENHRPPFIVMEFIAGQSLQQKIDRTGELELKEILRIGMQMARGLEAAHEQGLVHRDIKPANILLENGIERVKITDFGLARAVDDVSMTQTGLIAGTPQFMSPEQAQGHTIDERSDLFSFGSVLHMMCTGRPPFRADTPLAMLRRITDDTPRPIQTVNDEVPDWLCEIVEKLMEKNPDDRFSSASEVGDLLAQHLAHLQHPASSPQPRRLRQQSIAKPLRRPASRPPRRFWRGLAMLILLVFGISFAFPILVKRVTHGTVTIEVTDPGTIVEVAGNSVTLQSGVKTVTTSSGRYSARVRHGKLEFQTDDFDVREGDSVKVRVTLDDNKLTARAGGKFLGGRFLLQSIAQERLLRGHTATVTAVDISPTGEFALSASGWPNGDGTLRLWNLKTAQPVRQFEGHDGPIIRAVFSSDGRRIISGAVDHSARVWDVESGEEVMRFDGFKKSVYGVALSPDGTRALVSGDSASVHICDVGTGEIIRTLNQPQDKIMAVAISPDGRTALAGSGDEIYIWDLESYQQLGRLRGHTSIVQSIAFSRDSRLAVTASLDKTVRLWDLHARRQIGVFLGHTDGVLSARFSPDERLIVSGSHDHTIRVWSVATGQEIASGTDAGRSVWSVAITPDGTRLLSGGGQESDDDRFVLKDFDLRLWRLPENLRPWSNSQIDATLYCVSDQGLLKRIEIAQGSFRTSTIHALGVAFSDVEGLTMSDDATLYGAVHGANDMADLYSLDAHTGAATRIGETGFAEIDGLAWDGGRLLAATSKFGGYAGQLLAVDPATGKANPLGDALTLDDIDSLTFDDRGRLLTTDGMGTGDKIYHLDASGSSGPRALARTPPIIDDSRDIEGLTFAVDGKLYGVTHPNPFQKGPFRSHLVQIDPQTFEYEDLGQLEFAALCLAADPRKPAVSDSTTTQPEE